MLFFLRLVWGLLVMGVASFCAWALLSRLWRRGGVRKDGADDDPTDPSR